jgi:opacity protein-like surface antigen
MMRISALLTGSALAGGLLWAVPSFAQGADVMEDDEAANQDDEAANQDDSGGDEEASSNDNSGDGGWEEGGSSGESGVHFGLRLGYGIPLGDIASGSKLSDGVVGQIPIWVDLGWQFTPSFMVGAYFSYGFGILASDIRDACDASNVSCSIADIRLGLQAQYGFAPHKGANPWIGAGVGYEWLTTKLGDNSTTVRGFELPMLQAGVDFGGDSGGSTIGPFVAFTMSTFDKAKVRLGSVSQSGDITSTASHSWIFLGIRGVVN